MPPNKTVVPGSNPSLYKVIARIRATVNDTGEVDSAEVAQLYAGIPGDDTPVRQLQGFKNEMIAAGRCIIIKFDLRRKDLLVWDTVAQDWILRKGEYQISIGQSSRILPLNGRLNI